MAKYKYHERNDGTLGRCRAGEGANPTGCPFRISDADHVFADSIAEARQEQEERLHATMNTMTPSVSRKDTINTLYQQVSPLMERGMGVIGKLVVSSDKNVSSTISEQKGRQTSTDFEKYIAIPVIEGNQKSILRYINSGAKKDSLRATSLHIPSDQDEAGLREIADFFISLENSKSGEKVRMPVNIKYTKGTTKDNIMGKKAFLYMLGFDDKKKTYNEFASDYYLLSFTHGQDRPTDSFTSVSLLDSDPKSEGYLFNSAQSFPLQGRASAVVSGDSSRTLSERRADWMDWYANGRARQAKKLQDEVDAYRAESAKLRD